MTSKLSTSKIMQNVNQVTLVKDVLRLADFVLVRLVTNLSEPAVRLHV